MKIAWIVIADGVGQDARGAITAIAINQNVFAAPSLPGATIRAIIAHISGKPGELKTGDKFSVTYNVISPRGKVISAQSGQVSMGPIPWPELPIMADLPAQLVLNVSEYGTYRIEVSIQTPDGAEVGSSTDFYVVEAPDSNPAGSAGAPTSLSNPR